MKRAQLQAKFPVLTVSAMLDGGSPSHSGANGTGTWCFEVLASGSALRRQANGAHVSVVSDGG